MCRRFKIAFFSPVNPQPCGVSDYTEDLLPYLGQLADIDLVIESYRPSNQELLHRFSVIDAGQFRSRAASYDACIYQIANSVRYHGYTVPLLAEFPGIVVLHDISLQYLMLGLSVAQGDLRLLERFLAPAYGARAALLARRLLFSRVDPYKISMVRPILEWATGVIVHSEYVHARVLEEMPERDRDIRYMPMAVPVEASPAGRGPRQHYGFSEDDFIIGSVSTLSSTKRIELVLDAVHRLKPRFPAIRFVVLGGGTAGSQVRTLIERYGLQDRVIRTGRVTAKQYRDYIAMSDLVVDLRYPSGTEASASLTRAIAAGKPVLVSGHGWFLGLPEDFAMKVPVDDRGSDVLAAAIADLIEHPEKRRAMGSAAWEFARQHFRLEDCAARYIEFIEDIIARPRLTAGQPRHQARKPAGRLERALVGGVYNAFRLPHLARSYGMADTFAKIRQELWGAKKAEAGS